MYLQRKYLDNLKSYKYSAVDKSVLSKYVLTPYWNWLVTLFPKTIAPNTITFLGLCIIFFNFGTLVYYDPAFKCEIGGAQELPRWVYFSWGIGLFAYQSMDAIDGKQARRTGMAGPLGEMFDHGCDAINTTLEVVIGAYALNLGRGWWTIASMVAALTNFYLTTWEEYNTGTLYLSEFSGPVEGILLICGVYFITGVYGPSFWDHKVLHLIGIDRFPLLAKYIPDLGLNDSFMVFGAFSLAANIINSYGNVIIARRKANKAILPPLFGLIPFCVNTFLLLAWLLAEPTSNVLKSKRLLPFLGYWGFGFAYQVGTLILAHVAKMPFPIFNGLMLWSAVGALDANAQRIFGVDPILHATETRRNVFIGLSFVVALVTYLHFAFTVIWAITNHLGVACFTVRKKDKNGEWASAQSVDAQKEKSS